MTEFNAQKMIDFLNDRLQEKIENGYIETNEILLNESIDCNDAVIIHSQKELDKIKNHTEEVRMVERYIIKLETHGVCCLTCGLFPREYESCKNVTKCFTTAIKSDFQEYSEWEPQLTVDSFKNGK